MNNDQNKKIVILIPCLNEEITIGKVIKDFQAAIPEAEIIVFDNNSTDRTAKIALECGAKVIEEKRPGKGYVVSSMFRKVEADYYVLVDGDDTYSAEHVRQLLEPVMEDRADMAVGARWQNTQINLSDRCMSLETIWYANWLIGFLIIN